MSLRRRRRTRPADGRRVIRNSTRGSIFPSRLSARGLGGGSPAGALGWRFSHPRESPRGSHLPENQAQGCFVPAIDTGTFADNSDESLARVSWSKFPSGCRTLKPVQWISSRTSAPPAPAKILSQRPLLRITALDPSTSAAAKKRTCPRARRLCPLSRQKR